MAKAFYILCAAYLLSSVTAMAQTDHQLIRRIAVFPIKSSESLGNVADDAWWELREVLTKDKRFLVASKNFLMQKDVYQSRGLLSPADAIILGKLLDANVLISTFVEDRTLTMKVYEGEYGRLLWDKQFSLQPSLPVSQQLKSSIVKLAQDFISSIPYHGYVIVDSLKNRPVYQEGHRLLVKAEVGLNAEIDLGDAVQLVRVFSENLKPLFTNGASIEVFAEGRVVERDRSVILIELDRLNRAAQIQDGTLVRLPREMKRLEQQLAARDSLTGKIDPAFLSPGMTSAKQEVQEKRPLVAALTFILNIAGFLLIAF